MSLSRSNQATLAAGAYESNERALEMAKEIHPNWTIDPDFTNRNMTTYYRPDTKETVVSYKGTSNAKDVGTDLLYFMGLGQHGSRFKNSKATTKKIIEKYGKDNVSTASHSLGASIGSDISKQLDLPTTSFAKGRQIIATSGKKEKSYRNPLDPLSGSGVGIIGTGGKSVKPRSANPHKLSNF